MYLRILVSCLLLLALGPCPLSRAGEPEAAPPPPVEAAPRDAQVLRLGLLPLAVPSGPLGEAMRRDRVLAQGLRELDMEISYQGVPKGANGNQLLLEGKLDGLMAGDLPAIVAACRGRIVVATLLFQGFSALVAARPMPLGQLDGQVVGYAQGSVAHYGLFKALQQAGFSADNLTLVPMDASEMMAAVAQGRVAAVAVWEPYITMLLTRFPQAMVLHRTLYHGYLYFSRQAVEDHPKTVRLLIAAQLRAMAWMREKKANLLAASRWALQAQRQLAGSDPGITPEVYAQLVKGDLLDTSPTPEVPAGEEDRGGDLEMRFNFLKAHGMIPENSDFSAVQRAFDRTMVREVLADPAGYRLDQFDYQD